MAERAQCEQLTQQGKQCRRKAVAGSRFCGTHSRQQVSAPTTQVETRQDVFGELDRLGSLEERLAWVERVRRGEIKELRVNPKGASDGESGTIEVPTSTADKMRALKLAEELQDKIDKRDRNYVTREQFEHSCTQIALLVRDRMRTIPMRLYGQDVEKVQRLQREIDDVLADAADELERVLNDVLGEGAE